MSAMLTSCLAGPAGAPRASSPSARIASPVRTGMQASRPDADRPANRRSIHLSSSLSRPPGRTARARALGGDRDGRAKNLDRDGFLQEIGGASLHPFDAGRDGAVSGENDDLDAGVELPDLPQGGEAVHPRHLQVEDDDVGGQLFEKRQGRPRRERSRRVEAAPCEALGDGGSEVLLVIHDENPDPFGTAHTLSAPLMPTRNPITAPLASGPDRSRSRRPERPGRGSRPPQGSRSPCPDAGRPPSAGPA